MLRKKQGIKMQRARTFDSMMSESTDTLELPSTSPTAKDMACAASKYSHYIYNIDDADYTSPHSHTNGDIFDIIDALKRRKQARLRLHSHSHRQHTYARSPRFMLAAMQTSHSNPFDHRHRREHSASAPAAQRDRDREELEGKEAEIKSLRKEVCDKEELIKSLQYSLLQHAEQTAAPRRGHRREKSVTHEATEKSAMRTVQWGLRSEMSKMATAQNEVDRLLESVGDTSMMHGRLKKIQHTLSLHKRKVSAMEQSLGNDIGGLFAPAHPDTDEKDADEDEATLSQEYSKLKLQLEELRQEQMAWSKTKTELAALNKRCKNLCRMLDKLSDEKLELTLKIEDLHALLHKHNIEVQQEL